MSQYVLNFSDINKSSLAEVGGKGANLGELGRIPGIRVPAGFCVSTRAYADFINTSGAFAALLNGLSGTLLSPEQLKTAGKQIRDHIETLAIPSLIQQDIILAWQETGSQLAYAVRSSATAEDLPGASFAGQQDTFLNVKGEQQLLDCIRKCWASLFTERAIVYRQQNGFEHDKVLLSVVVQQMVFPEVSGIMFTADPVSGNRKTVVIDAGFGLGDALVSGIVAADLYQVQGGTLIKQQIARKETAIYAKPEGGTVNVEIAGERQLVPALAAADAIRLASLGRSIEAHFGNPQDIEWGIAGNEIFILQSRPITTLYPVPPASGDQLRLFVSIGHQQMMTEAMKPLGISVLKTLVPVGKSRPQEESPYLQEVGARLYLDLTDLLGYPQVRKRLPELLLNIDEMIGRAVRDFISRDEFQPSLQPDKKVEPAWLTTAFPTIFAVFRNILYRDNAAAMEEINGFIERQIHENRTKLLAVAGVARITEVQEILSSLIPTVLPRIAPYLGAGLITYKLIAALSQKWVGDAQELGDISKSPTGNVTTEMGLALGDVADAARPYPAVAAYLKQAADDSFFAGLRAVDGGAEVLPVLLAFFEQYGMRGTGEIDVTRPRWREAPTALVPAILSQIAGIRPGQHRLVFAAGKKEAELAADRLLERLQAKPGGFFKARCMRRLIKVHRAFIGLREHPKFFIVQNLAIIKQVLLQEAAQLTAAGVLAAHEDVYWFSLQEFKTIIATQQADYAVVAGRKEQFSNVAKLKPPRVMTSEGEIITANPGASVPAGALPGSPVSAGIVEGCARVILKLEEATMQKGDILVAPYTDPGWTPLFPLAAGLVTEVGGLMTHGAVVAREYGIPAVAGVDNATGKIQNGQRIRVDGTQGFVEFIE
ncbi:phosphoenolpyruvate synthase [Sporomusa termitida]|uniref:Prodigiosin synthesizing transferase PigC n=1 Tax=Sporomusa termitida TaxID=2377 RepID=A0A517E0Q4_9FIRM|nr:phosphoenolpyruvate synthase [Sporomusa termitida]QDR83187.1 Prodigiosin synthesizing transferase PigC [Sporomusa termitida]